MRVKFCLSRPSSTVHIFESGRGEGRGFTFRAIAVLEDGTMGERFSQVLPSRPSSTVHIFEGGRGEGWGFTFREIAVLDDGMMGERFSEHIIMNPNSVVSWN